MHANRLRPAPLRAVLCAAVVTAAVLLPGAARAASEVETHLPLSLGREWSYRTVKQQTIVLPDSQEMRQTVEGTSHERIAGKSDRVGKGRKGFVLVQEIEETNQATGATTSATVRTHLSSEPDQVLAHAQEMSGVPGMPDSLVMLEAPMALLKLPLPAEGEAWPSILHAGPLTIDSRPRARAVETVETTAGTFEDCLRITTQGPVTGALPGPQPLPIGEASIEETLWFARGVGLVKQVQVLRVRIDGENGQTIRLTEEKTKTLTAYRK